MRRRPGDPSAAGRGREAAGRDPGPGPPAGPAGPSPPDLRRRFKFPARPGLPRCRRPANGRHSIPKLEQLKVDSVAALATAARRGSETRTSLRVTSPTESPARASPWLAVRVTGDSDSDDSESL